MIDTLTKNLPNVTTEGWGQYENRAILEPTIAALRRRPGRVFFEKVKGHSGDAGNDRADLLAGKAVSEGRRARVDLEVPTELRSTGMQLASLTQSKAYKNILAWKTRKSGERIRTIRMLERVRNDTKTRIGRTATDATIWKSLVSKNIMSKKVKAFLWRAAHDCVPCGHIWEKAKGFEGRAKCDTCNTTESLEHILTECTHSGQEVIWGLVKEALKEKGVPWEEITLAQWPLQARQVTSPFAC
ncbi:hypothetical protein DFP72DRAFT_819135 [Ephemerocybe angulata]|uniref:RNase H type-1 domain-containing protein n=1 Tax=Ephemerocybe angulata TaxID=980116 RepID=A0A8H6HLN3_9AGAR|nr:hypothetical protein DFP72DRAFT_819135 [Tulosesus angulatus]